jgi:hypothetical protein
MGRKREKKPKPESSRSEEDLKKLAKAIHRNEVFVATDEKKLRLSFGIVLAFIGKKLLEDMAKNDIVAFYEYYNDPVTGAKTHGPMSVNGMPMFHSARVLTRGDYKKVMGYCEKFRIAEEKALEG